MGFIPQSGSPDDLLRLTKKARLLIEVAKKEGGPAGMLMKMKLMRAVAVLTSVRDSISANKQLFPLAEFVLDRTGTLIQIANAKLSAGQVVWKIGNKRQAEISFFDAAKELESAVVKLETYLLGNDDGQFRGYDEWWKDPPGGGD